MSITENGNLKLQGNFEKENAVCTWVGITRLNKLSNN